MTRDRSHAPKGPTPRRRSTGASAFVCRAAVALLLAAAATGRPIAQAPHFDETQVKAAFLINVGLFAEWPAGAMTGQGFVVAIFGDDALASALEQSARGKKAQGRELLVKRLAGNDDSCACQVLFLSQSDGRRSTEWLRTVKASPVLTVGETPAFLRDGGALRFYVESERLRFSVNQENAQRAGLRLSSQLLKLATK
jgi:hypothetical protein